MKKVMIALLLLSVCGSAVFAGEWKKDGSVAIGAAMPMGDIGDIVDGSMAWGFDYDGYKINDNVSIGAGLFYTNADGKDSADIAGFTNVDLSAYEFSTMGITPFVKYGKEVDLGGKKANLYGTFGLGFYTSDSNAPGSDSSTDFGFNLGGGLMYPIADKMNLGLDLKYHSVSADDITVTYLVPSLKFTYSF